MTDSKLKIKYWQSLNGQYHRENGPAAIYQNGDMFWYINNKHHRVDGPARDWKDWQYADKSWWLNKNLIRVFSYD